VIIDLGYRRALRPLLFRAYDGDAERAHEQTLAAVARVGRSRPARAAIAALCARHRAPATVSGIEFPGMVGLAAGMARLAGIAFPPAQWAGLVAGVHLLIWRRELAQ